MKKIIIAEDSSVIQNIAKKVLQFQNYDIVTVKTGKEFLEKIETQQFDIILLDINIPIVDGMECAKRVRAATGNVNQNIPILAVTGNDKNYTMEDFNAVGINNFLLKPLNFDVLVSMVKQYAND
jgi:CheY-like chemotaxis protein